MKIYILVNSLIFCISLPNISFACLCERTTTKQEFNNSKSIIVATVLHLKDTLIYKESNQGIPEHYNLVEVEIDSIFKGKKDMNSLIFLTYFTGEQCGYSFEVGKEYLIYTYNTDSQFQATNKCTHTKPISTVRKRELKTLQKLAACEAQK